MAEAQLPSLVCMCIRDKTERPSAQTTASPSGSQSPSPPQVESEDYPLTKMADHDLTLGALGIPGKGKHYVSWEIFMAYACFHSI